MYLIIFIPLRVMEIEIINRISVGMCVGFSYFDEEEGYPYRQLGLHLLIIDVVFKWKP